MYDRVLCLHGTKTDLPAEERKYLQPDFQVIHVRIGRVAGRFGAVYGQVFGDEFQLGDVPFEGWQIDAPAGRALEFRDHTLTYPLFERIAVEIPHAQGQQRRSDDPGDQLATFAARCGLRVGDLCGHFGSGTGEMRRITACARKLCTNEVNPSVTRCSTRICWIFACT